VSRLGKLLFLALLSACGVPPAPVTPVDERIARLHRDALVIDGHAR
jgi:hypothetical protein